MWFLNRFDTNRAVQAQKMARGWKFWIKKVEELYYPCSENKGADQITAPLFLHMQNVCFLMTWLKCVLCTGNPVWFAMEVEWL